MRRYIFVAAGGMLGAAARFALKDARLPGISTFIPVGTLTVNILGCFAIAFTLILSQGFFHFGEDLRIGFTSGFLGAFTTFSTLCREIAGLYGRSPTGGALYAAVSIVSGLLAAYAGTGLAHFINKRKAGVQEDDSPERELLEEEGEL